MAQIVKEQPAVPGRWAGGRRVREHAVASPSHRRGDGRLAWLLITPAVAGFLVFFAYPTVRGVYYSFTSFHILTAPKWVGLANWREMFGDSVFWHSLLVTVYFVVLAVVIGVLLSLVTAVVLHRLTRSTVIRGLIILPFLISGVVAALVWQWMLDPQLGIISQLLEKATGVHLLFFSDSHWAIPSLAAVSVWKSMGYNAVLIFAGLQTIPPSVYEAGRLDGASEFQMFRRLTVPLLRPILVMVVILTVIGSFQVFDIVSVTTQGGPANASNVLQMYIYEKGFGELDFGYASTMSLALFVLLIAITFTQMRLARANETDLS
ncbi:carbohydrate ABC transporter permease [Streptomyces sp. 8L]|uniref:carbohydrate ABC transporter permease n=1 Tax=unclassified Streptomyces TaxID=2593676 RepID=UPI0035A88144